MLRSRLAGVAAAATLSMGGAVGVSLFGVTAAHAAEICVDTTGNVGINGSSAGCSAGTGGGPIFVNNPPALTYFAIVIDIANPEAAPCDADDTCLVPGVLGASVSMGGTATAPTGEAELCATGGLGCTGIESVPAPD